MGELRAAELAMTGSETRELLAAHGVSLPDREFKLLEARTEGWMAGVRLSAIRMEGTPRPADFVAELALDHGSIGEYLIDEVLDRQPDQVRRLLIETSFLPEVSGCLAEAITGLSGCADMLDELAHSNSFVIPLDHTRTRFRYHQLFAETLRYLLQRRAPQLAPTLYRRAAAWFEAQDDLENALNWAVQAGDQPNVAALLVHGGLAQGFVTEPRPRRLRGRRPAAHTGARRRCLRADDRVRHGERGNRGRHRRPLQRRARSRRSMRASQPVSLADPDVRMTADLVELVLGQKANDHAAVDAASTRLLADAAPDRRRPARARAAGVRPAGARPYVVLGRAFR